VSLFFGLLYLVLVCLSTCGHGSGNGTPCAGRAICASFDPLGVYIYAVGVESCATRLPLLRSVPLTDPNRGRAWHPREFGAVLSGSASLPLPAPPLPSSSRRYAPQCFVGGYTSSPCDVSHRASDEPRRRMSLSSALAPSSLASPSHRRVFLRSLCARRRSVSSLNLARVSPGAKRSRRRRAQCGVQIRRAALVGAPLRGARFPAANPPRFRPHRNLFSSRLDFFVLLFDGEKGNIV